MTATIPNPCGASWAADYGPLPCDRPHGHDGMHRTYGSQGPIEWSTPVLPASAPAATPLMDSLRECDEKAKDLPTWATDINAAHAAQYGRPAATAGTDFPRRNQMLQWTTGERAIYDAVQVVERMGADVRLTDAVILLGKARDRVADFVEGVAPESTAHAPFAMPERSKEWWLERVDREGEYAVGAGAAAPTGEEAETGCECSMSSSPYPEPNADGSCPLCGKRSRRVAVETLDYPAAARSIALNLAEFCDESLAYPEMIAEAARQAATALAALRARVEELEQDKARMDRIEWADTVLLAREDEDDPQRRFSFRDMATPPTTDNPDGTIFGPTARAVLDAALRAALAPRQTTEGH